MIVTRMPHVLTQLVGLNVIANLGLVEMELTVTVSIK